MSDFGSHLVYSIQRTYILTPVLTPKKAIVTCNQRIDIPTIEPLTRSMKRGAPQLPSFKIIPCIELAGDFLAKLDLTFETNEGVTVLPIKIDSTENPYTNYRYVLVLPRGATGVKSCRVIDKATGLEVQHNFTFGIMPPPYNYDNELFGYLYDKVAINYEYISTVDRKVTNLEARVTALENKAGE